MLAMLQVRVGAKLQGAIERRLREAQNAARHCGKDPSTVTESNLIRAALAHGLALMTPSEACDLATSSEVVLKRGRPAGKR